MRETLDRLAVPTGRALGGIWDDVGVVPDERASHLANLVKPIAHLCEAKVGEEEALREQFRKEIADTPMEYGEICAALRLEGEEDPVARMSSSPASSLSSSDARERILSKITGKSKTIKIRGLDSK